MFRRLFAGALLAAHLLGFTAPAQAGVGVKSVQIVPSADGVLYSRFPAGDAAPGPGNDCDVPTGWACISLGDAGGSIVRVTDSKWDLNVLGSTSVQKIRMAYKDAGTAATDEVQLIARVLSPYTGSLEALAGFGIGLREGIGTTDFFFQCLAAVADTTAITSNWGTTAADVQKVLGALGQSLPRYIGATYDPVTDLAKCHESDDGSTWTQTNSVSHVFADVKASIFGQSRSATAATAGQIEAIALTTGAGAITIYNNDPPGPPDPGNTAPVITGIPNQSWAQDISVSLNVAPFCVDADGDPITFSATGLSGHGLAISSAGLITGIPNSTAASDSPFNVVVTCTDDELVSDTDTFQVTVAGSSGDTFGPYGSAVTEINCTMPETSTRKGYGAGAGDTIIINGENRGQLTIAQCSGSPSSRLTIRNDTTDSQPAVIRKSSSGGFAFLLDGLTDVIIDGTGKYSGAPSGECGVNQSTLAVQTQAWLDGSSRCGIIVARGASVGHPTAYVQIKGINKRLTIKGIEVDGIAWDSGGGSGLGVQLNDHAIQRTDNPGIFQEDILIQNNYAHDTGASCYYIGPNYVSNDIPLRDIEQSYNVCTTSGRRCNSTKSSIEGINTIHHNFCDTAGLEAATGGFGNCITFHDGAGDIYSNVVRNCGENGIAFTVTAQGAPASVGPLEGRIYNNIIENTGLIGPGGTNGIAVTRATSSNLLFSPMTIENNTIIEPNGDCIKVDALVNGTKIARDNICAAAANGNRAITGITDTNNLKGDVGAMNFVNSATHDFHLTSSSLACNADTNNDPSLDYEDELRPMDSRRDQGADEASACP